MSANSQIQEARARLGPARLQPPWPPSCLQSARGRDHAEWGCPAASNGPPHPPSGGPARTLGPNRPVHTYGGQRACSPVLCGLAHPAQLGCSLAQLELGSFQMQHGSQGGAGSPHSCSLESSVASWESGHTLTGEGKGSLPPSSWVEGLRVGGRLC